MKTGKDTSMKNTLCSGKSRNIVGRIPFQLFLVFGACASFSEGHKHQHNDGLSYWYPSLKQRHDLKLRGGSSYNSGAIELNPEYHSYVPPSNEHEAWLQQQQQQQQQNQPATAKPFQQTSFQCQLRGIITRLWWSEYIYPWKSYIKSAHLCSGLQSPA